eukprot:37865-Prymnesium_polylepis.1
MPPCRTHAEPPPLGRSLFYAVGPPRPLDARPPHWLAQRWRSVGSRRHQRRRRRRRLPAVRGR